MTPDHLAQIEAEANAATEGPWKSGHGQVAGLQVLSPGLRGICCMYSDKATLDATFIANARQNIPDLIAEVRRLQTEIDGYTTLRTNDVRLKLLDVTPPEAHAAIGAVFASIEIPIGPMYERDRMEREIAHLQAENEEARLTLLAEQGHKEGAPSEGWTWTNSGWEKSYPTGHEARIVSPHGSPIVHIFHHTEPHRRFAQPTMRAAMKTCDAPHDQARINSRAAS